MGFFDLGQRRARRLVVDALYAKAVDQARQAIFYSKGGVADTVDGRFDLLVLHMFLLLHRLGAEGAAMRGLSQSLFDLMFDDMDRSLREMGVSDMAVGKRVKEMAQAFYGRIDAYEPALADPEQLQVALGRNLYRGGEVAAETVQSMARYVQTQVDVLAGRAVTEITSPSGACFGDVVLA
jgi:cytochrome b pre-mRNA-processing protein 3